MISSWPASSAQLANLIRAMASKRKALTLKDKVGVLDYVKKNPSAGSRKISGVFGCGKTQIQSILNNKQSIMDEYEAN